MIATLPNPDLRYPLSEWVLYLIHGDLSPRYNDHPASFTLAQAFRATLAQRGAAGTDDTQYCGTCNNEHPTHLSCNEADDSGY